MSQMENYWLSKINEIKEEEVKQQYQSLYENLKNSRYFRNITPDFEKISISSLLDKLEKEIENMTSFYTFPNQRVSFYPTFRERKSTKHITCAFSNSVIKKGSLYCNYRPLLDVIDSKRTFVLDKSLKVEIGYLSELPTTIHEFDDFSEKVENYWNYPNEPLDYEAINYYLGGTVRLLELRKEKRK